MQSDDEDFSEERVFSNSFFYRTHLQWNSLPFELKNIKEHSKFESKLKVHMWNLIPGHNNWGSFVSEQRIYILSLFILLPGILKEYSVLREGSYYIGKPGNNLE